MTKTQISPAAAAIDAQITFGAILVDVKCSWALDCRVTSLTGLNGSPKSITVREIGENARDRDLIINRRSLAGYRVA